ncbi:MAG: glycosyltransferase family 2 protein [Elusimicrobiota bacterium]
MSLPKVSVVIDNYNYGRFIGEAVRSVLDQDYSGELECIVADDGSTDDSRDVARSFGSKVKVLEAPNQGQATAFNRGFAAASGQIVCLLDSDDYWPPDKVRRVAERFEDPGVGLVQHMLRDVGLDGRPVPQRMPGWPEHYTLDDFLDKRIDFTATSGLAFRKSVLDRITPLAKDVFYYLDDLLFGQALFFSKAANIREVLGVHRMHAANFCAEGYWDPKKLETDMRCREIFFRELAPYLKRHAKEFTPRFWRLEEMEYARRRILLDMLQGKRGAAFSEWTALVAKHGATFKAASCSLALISPMLYRKFYQSYSFGLISKLRRP